MNTKFASFILTLVLTAVACEAPSQYSIVRQTPDGRVPTIHPTLTSTTSHDPAAKVTGHKLVAKVAKLTGNGPVAKVTGPDGVNIRVGPCNQPIITNASYGAELPVTGWYKTPNGYIWWRVKPTANSGQVFEGWVFGGFVTVSNAADLPFVPSQCPPFPSSDKTSSSSAPIPTVTAAGPPACRTGTLEFRPKFWTKNDFKFTVSPRLLKGDGEFGRNGPKVSVLVKLTHDAHTARVEISMLATETAFDWTTARDEKVWNLLSVPAGWRIRTMNLGKVDAATGLDYGEWLFSYTDDDFDVDIFEPQDGGPLSRIEVLGDTDGIDIRRGMPGGSTARGGTEAVVWFHNPIKVEVIQEGNCQ